MLMTKIPSNAATGYLFFDYLYTGKEAWSGVLVKALRY
jgi:hypothetical protein